MSLFSSSLPVAAISISSRNHSQLPHISPTYHQLEFEFERLFSNLNKATLKRVSGSLSSSILLVAGTTVGAGILAIPAVTQEYGFLASAVACILCWIFMVSMAKKTLGTVGVQIARWECATLFSLVLGGLCYSGRTAIVLGTAIPLGLFLVSK